MTKEKLKEIAKSIKIEINDNVSNDILNLYDELTKKIGDMKSIDTENVSSMSRIDETPITFLREDVVVEALPKSVILNNAPESDNDFVVINSKDVSND